MYKWRDTHLQGDKQIPDIIACDYQVRPDMANGFYDDFPEFASLKPNVHGAENLRKIVQVMIAHHVNIIKLFLTERADNKPEDVVPKRTFTDEEIISAVDEATKAGIPVAAHEIRNDDAAYTAVKAGVRSIEHGIQLSDKTLALMKMKGTYLVPTFSFWDQSPNPVLKIDPSVLVERKRVYLPVLTNLVNRAYKIGVSVIGGTDTRYSEPGHTMADEALYLHKAGIPAMEVIKAITSSPAHCLGVQSRTGSIKKGMEADLIIVGQNPLKDLQALQHILMVINDGQIVLNKINQ